MVKKKSLSHGASKQQNSYLRTLGSFETFRGDQKLFDFDWKRKNYTILTLNDGKKHMVLHFSKFLAKCV